MTFRLTTRNAAGLLAAAALLLTSTPSHAGEVVRTHRNGVPAWVEGQLGSFSTPDAELGPTDEYYQELYSSAEAAIRESLQEYMGATGEEALVASSTHFDEFDSAFVGFTQSFSGLPVVGAGFRVELALKDGLIRRIHGRFYPARDEYEVNQRDLMDPELALARAFEEAGLRGETLGEAELLFLGGGDELHLSYRTLVSLHGTSHPDHVFVTAKDGRLLGMEPTIHTAYPPQPGPTPPPVVLKQEFRTYTETSGSPSPPHSILELCNLKVYFPFPAFLNVFSAPCSRDGAVSRAHQNAIDVFRYYRKEHKYVSYDNAYSPLVSIANFPLNSAGQTNAGWSPSKKQMTYGVTDGMYFKDLTFGFDVAAHEFTHGITQNLAGLIYNKESGALNEGMSDIFAAAVESWKDGAVSADTWLVGEDVVLGALAPALRYMHNPSLDSAYLGVENASRDFYPERLFPDPCTPMPSNDYCGVHYNSGIANLAFYLLVEGGTHPTGKTTVVVPGIGMKQAITIFFAALSDMNPSDDFAAARLQTVNKATLLYGAAAADSVTKAWDAVGVPQ